MLYFVFVTGMHQGQSRRLRVNNRSRIQTCIDAFMSNENALVPLRDMALLEARTLDFLGFYATVMQFWLLLSLLAKSKLSVYLRDRYQFSASPTNF